VRDTLLLTEHQLRSWSKIAVATDLAPQLPPLACDRNQITQVLINLLTNARDAMPEGGAITMRTWHDAIASRLVLQVSDLGPGISEDTRARIF
jgi:signal transduction histidine kinase